METNLQLTDISESMRKIDRFRGAADTLIQQKARIITEISEAKHYLDQKDNVLLALEALQDKTQEKTKEIYEVLLTKLIHEVKGYDVENHRLCLNTRMKSNKPWLDVEIESASGHTRDVYLDKGGSIKNIVAMGLRFVTLSRTSNRRFLVFDEADKDLNPKYIPGIAKILQQLSIQVKMQVLYISHHDPAHFDGYAKIVNLTRVKGSITTETVSEADNGKVESVDDEISDYMDGVGIDYIRLVNVKQHKNTIIELSPYVTVITGDNDIGKSTIVQAIDAVNNNKGRAGLIRDDQSDCRIEMGLEDETTLSWSYKRRGSKKTIYKISDSDNVALQYSDSGNNAPEWLSDYLSMSPYKDFDLHISNQDNANFILDSKVSGHRRAEILSLGKETNQVMAMIKNHSLESDRKTKLVNQLKKELTQVKNRLEVYRQVGNLEEMVNMSIASAKEIRESEISINSLKEKISSQGKMDKISNSMSELTKINQVIPVKITVGGNAISLIKDMERAKDISVSMNKVFDLKMPLAPIIESLSYITENGRSLAKHRDCNSALSKISDVSLLKEIEINDIQLMQNIINQSSRANDKKAVMKTLPLNSPEQPVIRDFSSIITIGEGMKKFRGNVESSNTDIEKTNISISTLNNERNILIDELGSDCPVCGGTIHKERCAQ